MAEDNTAQLEAWVPKTTIGRLVKSGQITNIDQILDKGEAILEPEIVDMLLPDLTTELLLIGQAKGKFGGGQRRVFRQTQKKTREGNKPSFATMAVVGNKNGYVGIGFGKSRETVPAREKAIRSAKKNIFKVARGCGSWQCACKTPHTVPYEVHGKEASVEIRLIPAPKGKGLVVEKECAKVLAAAGIDDVWSKSFGMTKNKVNLLRALEKALKSILSTKIQEHHKEVLSFKDGMVNTQ
jgi:small subunit ribosomal protein S5